MVSGTRVREVTAGLSLYPCIEPRQSREFHLPTGKRNHASYHTAAVPSAGIVLQAAVLSSDSNRIHHTNLGRKAWVEDHLCGEIIAGRTDVVHYRACRSLWIVFFALWQRLLISHAMHS
jgi:hypothetical protein